MPESAGQCLIDVDKPSDEGSSLHKAKPTATAFLSHVEENATCVQCSTHQADPNRIAQGAVRALHPVDRGLDQCWAGPWKTHHDGVHWPVYVGHSQEAASLRILPIFPSK